MIYYLKMVTYLFGLRSVLNTLILSVWRYQHKKLLVLFVWGQVIILMLLHTFWL